MLRVLSLNVWNDSGPWALRAERIRGWIERLSPDLIAFQEVLQSPQRDLARELVGHRGYHLAFARASGFWKSPEESFGNAIASRWPIAKTDSLPLFQKEGDHETRVALLCHIESPHGPLVFSSTHLNWKFHHGFVREKQVVALADFVRGQRVHRAFPAIIAGDFNAEPDSDEIRYMTGRHSIDGRSVYWNDAWLVAGRDGDGVTWSNRNAYAREALEPDRRIDYVFVDYPLRDGRGVIESCRVVANDERAGVWPSDHFGVYAELRTDPL
ncbi:MAG TPA: endonuclease/exonuclease/phosphatase family protein [Myxococcota bacterium]|nr:endonuclease/exonuclease/phosphatase family protein [Myxococcota bacterium]